MRSLFNIVSFKSVFKNADLILDIGQGDSFSDIYGKYRFDSINLIHLIAQKLKKPYCILPQTIGSFENIDLKKKQMRVLKMRLFVLLEINKV